jgi:hypothetical protein
VTAQGGRAGAGAGAGAGASAGAGAGAGSTSPTKAGSAVGTVVGHEIAAYKTHLPAGKGTKFVDQDAVTDMKGPLRKSAPNLPRGFVTSIYHTHTARQVRTIVCTTVCMRCVVACGCVTWCSCVLCGSQVADFLPDVPNTNVPRSLGVVMPRQILEDWSAIGFDPWSAGKQLRTTTMVSDLTAMETKSAAEEDAEGVASAQVLGESVGM